MKDLKMVYNFVDRYPNFGMYFLILLFAAIGFGIFYIHWKRFDKNETDDKRRSGMISGLMFFFLPTFLAAFLIPSDIKEYIKTQEIFDKKQYKMVEGRVSNFNTYGKLAIEQFDVNGVHFDFSDDRDYGYHGGAIRENLFVQISYFNNGGRNVILKLKTE